jgi:hypothetical protein
MTPDERLDRAVTTVALVLIALILTLGLAVARLILVP